MTARKTPSLRVARPDPAPAGEPVQACVLRIELRDLKPKIWRELWVPPAITLRRLHAVIQAAMGWENAHLYGFAIPGTGRAGHYWGVPPHQRFEPKSADDGLGFGAPANNDARQPLDGVLRAPNDKLLYLYDYGDDWEHLITLRGIVEVSEALPHLAAGQGGCPPEDCGGPAGFASLVQAWHDPGDPEHQNVREWLAEMGVAGEPGALDAAGWTSLQKAVARLQPTRRAPKT